MCSPVHKGHKDLTSSPPSSCLWLAVFIQFQKEKPKINRGYAQLQELTVHLTTRADDSHATPENPKIQYVSVRMTDLLELVRLRAYYRIKPHAPPLV